MKVLFTLLALISISAEAASTRWAKLDSKYVYCSPAGLVYQNSKIIAQFDQGEKGRGQLALCLLSVAQAQASKVSVMVSEAAEVLPEDGLFIRQEDKN